MKTHTGQTGNKEREVLEFNTTSRNKPNEQEILASIKEGKNIVVHTRNNIIQHIGGMLTKIQNGKLYSYNKESKHWEVILENTN